MQNKVSTVQAVKIKKNKKVKAVQLKFDEQGNFIEVEINYE